MYEGSAEDALAILIAALEPAMDAVVLVDAAERVILFNAAAERLWGCDRTEILGARVSDALPQLAKGLAKASAVPKRGNRAKSAIEETRIERCDGTSVVAAIAVSQTAVGAATIYMASVRDVTEDARGRDELRLLTLVADETGHAVVIADAERRIVYVNQAFTEIFGYERWEVAGKLSRDVFAERTAPRELISELRRRVDGAKSFTDDLLIRDKSGRNIWVHTSISPVLDEAGNIRNVVSVIHNVTESKQLQVLQRDVLEAVAHDLPLTEVMTLICRRVEEVAPDVVCSVLAVDADKRLRALGAPSLPVEVSNAIDGLAIGPDVGSCGTAAFRGEPVLVTDVDSDPLWTDYKGLILPLGLVACWSSPIKLRDGKVAGTFAFYYRENRGPSPWHELVVNACLHLCVLAIERHEAKAHIARLAYSDMLTGLPNRLRLREIVRAAISDGSRQESALLFLDIDRFKDVNDTLGHSVGDRLLMEIARRLQERLAPGQTVGRYGGDEFVIMLPDCDAEQAGGIAAELIGSLLKPVVIENMLLPLSASIGICLYPSGGRDEESLLKHADTAMYEAKSAGGGTFRFFSPEMNSLAQERLVLGAALREAIDRRQLRLHYQPQVDCRTGVLRGVEALARWTHPIFGEVSPARFIALAEECGLIEQIGQWALDEACGQMAAWLKQGIGLAGMSVNLSAVHFRNPDLTCLVSQALERHRLKPEMLTIEITEGVIMDDNRATIETAKAIHGLGVRLSLDDFGTGYSSLSYLARLPIHELKIDRSFMRDLDNDKNAQAVVTAVVRIGQSLGLTVVAEGVESRSQRQFLEALECDVVQGFLVARAMPPVEFERWGAAYASAQRVVQLSGAA